MTSVRGEDTREQLQQQLQTLLARQVAARTAYQAQARHCRRVCRQVHDENVVLHNVVAEGQRRRNNAAHTARPGVAANVTAAEEEHLTMRIQLATRRRNRLLHEVRTLRSELQAYEEQDEYAATVVSAGDGATPTTRLDAEDGNNNDNNATRRSVQSSSNSTNSGTVATATCSGNGSLFLRVQGLERRLQHILREHGRVQVIAHGYADMLHALEHEALHYDAQMRSLEKEMADRHHDHVRLATLYRDAVAETQRVQQQCAALTRQQTRMQAEEAASVTAQTTAVARARGEAERVAAAVSAAQEELTTLQQQQQQQQQQQNGTEHERLTSASQLRYGSRSTSTRRVGNAEANNNNGNGNNAYTAASVRGASELGDGGTAQSTLHTLMQLTHTDNISALTHALAAAHVAQQTLRVAIHSRRRRVARLTRVVRTLRHRAAQRGVSLPTHMTSSSSATTAAAAGAHTDGAAQDKNDASNTHTLSTTTATTTTASVSHVLQDELHAALDTTRSELSQLLQHNMVNTTLLCECAERLQALMSLLTQQQQEQQQEQQQSPLQLHGDVNVTALRQRLTALVCALRSCAHDAVHAYTDDNNKNKKKDNDEDNVAAVVDDDGDTAAAAFAAATSPLALLQLHDKEDDDEGDDGHIVDGAKVSRQAVDGRSHSDGSASAHSGSASTHTSSDMTAATSASASSTAVQRASMRQQQRQLMPSSRGTRTTHIEDRQTPPPHHHHPSRRRRSSSSTNAAYGGKTMTTMTIANDVDSGAADEVEWSMASDALLLRSELKHISAAIVAREERRHEQERAKRSQSPGATAATAAGRRM